MRKLNLCTLVSFVFIFHAIYLLANTLAEDKALNLSPGSAPGYNTKVVKVLDGDTMILSNGEKVRLIGVDTPEVAHPLKSVQYFGKEASSFTKKMVEGKKVRLEFDWQRRDRYNRLLAYVYLEDGTFVNAEIIKQGYGFAYTRFPFNYLEEFRRYQREAREKNRGLWRGGGEAELKWLEASAKQPFKLYKMANDLWGIRFGEFVKTRISNYELAQVLGEAESLANECHEKDLQKKLLQRGWKKEYQGKVGIIPMSPFQAEVTHLEEPSGKFKVISWMDAHKYSGEKVTVEGIIIASHNSGKACFLNFHENWKKYFTAVIFQSDFGKFPKQPELYYKGKKVQVTGKVKEYKGKPEIILKDPSQIRIINPDRSKTE